MALNSSDARIHRTRGPRARARHIAVAGNTPNYVPIAYGGGHSWIPRNAQVQPRSGPCRPQGILSRTVPPALRPRRVVQPSGREAYGAPQSAGTRTRAEPRARA